MSKSYTRKSNKRSTLSMGLMLLLTLAIIIGCGIRVATLHQRSKELSITQAQLEERLEEVKNECKELEERGKYMKTKKYIEDEAKNKLGLVNKDEILIKPKQKDD